MSTDTRDILNRVLALPDNERARIVDELLTSLNQPDDEIDALWRKEIEDRIAAYHSGILRSVPLNDVLAKHRK